MTKKAKWLLFLVTLTVAFNFWNDSQYQAQDISEFIIGRWRGEFQQTGEDSVEYELFFVWPNFMFCSKTTPVSELHNILFRYKFVAADRVLIEGRVNDEITVARDGEHLVISSTSGFIQGGNYTRLSMFDNWACAAMIIGVLSLGTLLVRPYAAHASIQNTSAADVKSISKPVLHSIAHMIAIIVMLGLGVLVARAFWTRAQHLIRIPWDSIIMIELSAAIFILGIKNIRATHLAIRVPYISVVRWLHYLGMFLIGSGLWGIGIGLVKLIILFNVGSYSPF